MLVLLSVIYLHNQGVCFETLYSTQVVLKSEDTDTITLSDHQKVVVLVVAKQESTTA